MAPRHGAVKSFTYFLRVPGLKTDASPRDAQQIYAPESIVRLESEAELRAALERLPGWTTNKSGTARGDPLNLVLIGKQDDLFPAFLRRGWHPTEVVYLGSSWKTLKSFVLGSRYRYSPVSPLYTLGRFQDVAAQKAPPLNPSSRACWICIASGSEDDPMRMQSGFVDRALVRRG